MLLKGAEGLGQRHWVHLPEVRLKICLESQVWRPLGEGPLGKGSIPLPLTAERSHGKNTGGSAEPRLHQFPAKRPCLEGLTFLDLSVLVSNVRIVTTHRVTQASLSQGWADKARLVGGLTVSPLVSFVLGSL